MREMMIEKNMKINDIDRVKDEIEAVSGKRIKDMEIVRKFITTEKNTKFYIDKKMKSSVNSDTDHTYVWLDTGYVDPRGNAIFISLLNNGGFYSGYYVGTARTLSEGIKQHFIKFRKDVPANYSRFISKYNQKCSERENQHIENEDQYLICKVNEGNDDNEIANMLRNLNVEWAPEPEEPDVVEEAEEEEPFDVFNAQEEEITIGLLLDILAEREQYIQELLGLLENLENHKIEKDAEIQHLVEVIKEQSSVIKERTDAITRIRTFNESESLAQYNRDTAKEENEKEKIGHNLLDKHKKIVVIGTTSLSVEVLKGIVTKEFGFEEEDFVYETDYDKVVHSSGRILNSSKYQAIIFGCCPHSAMGKGKWSSLIESCKQNKDVTIVVDARNISGNLKVTKTSFREALIEICTRLSN